MEVNRKERKKDYASYIRRMDSFIDYYYANDERFSKSRLGVEKAYEEFKAHCSQEDGCRSS